MKKIILSLGILCSFYSQSQIEFNHSLGATYMLVAQNSYIGGYPGITYNPRLDFVISDAMSASFTVYPTIAANTEMGYVAIHMPVVGQFNIGNHSSADNESKAGFFINGGFSFGAYSDAGAIVGPCVGLGAKFGQERSYGIRFEMVNGKKDVFGNPNRVFSLGILYNFL